MGTTTVQEIFTSVRRLLSDRNGRRWPDATLLEYLNTAQREMARLRPDVSQKLVGLALVPGVRQQLPEEALDLVAVFDGTDASGVSTGFALETTIAELATENPRWTADPTADEVEHFVYDRQRDRQVLWVYPPQPDGTTNLLNISYSVIPAKLADVSDMIGLRDEFVTNLVEYVTYLAFDEDSLVDKNSELAERHKANALKDF